jgi:hypothetical protein
MAFAEGVESLSGYGEEARRKEVIDAMTTWRYGKRMDHDVAWWLRVEVRDDQSKLWDFRAPSNH